MTRKPEYACRCGYRDPNAGTCPTCGDTLRLVHAAGYLAMQISGGK